MPTNGATTTDLGQEVAALADWRRHTPGEWLNVVVDPQHVRTALIRHVPEFAGGGWRLDHCQVKRLRLRDKGGCWTGAYLLTVTEEATGATQTAAVVGTLYPPGFPEPAVTSNGHTFGSADWHYYLPELRLELQTQPKESALPALAQLTDPEQACPLLETGIRSGSSAYPDLSVQACHPQVMRYKPGSRCTVLYHLDYGADAQPGWPGLVVAKTYRGDKGENAYRGMRALWESPLGKSPTVEIAEPLAYLPTINVLIQGPIRQQQTLKELIRQVIYGDGAHLAPLLDDYLHQFARLGNCMFMIERHLQLHPELLIG
jgi:hypothetical protein